MKRISLRTIVVLAVCLAIALATTAGVLATRPATAQLQSLGGGLPRAGPASAGFSSAGLVAEALPSTPAVVTGTVTHDVVYRERAFPMGKGTLNTSQVLTIQLLDLTASDEAPVLLAEEIIYIAGGPPPYEFTIRPDPAVIRPDGVYALTAVISVDGRAMFEAWIGPVALQPAVPAQLVLVLTAVDLARSTGLPAGISRLARFSY